MPEDGPTILEGMRQYTRDDGTRMGWFRSRSSNNGKRDSGGYEYYRVGNSSLAHHRILAYAWGMIDSVYDDSVEIDHMIPYRSLNVEWNLQPLDQRTHSHITHQRKRARDAGQKQMTLEGEQL